MFFREVIGHGGIKNRLIQSVKENRVSHAQLFLGPEGSGNLAMALAYAQFISCENKQESDSCGSCLSCLKYNKFAHPDLHFVFPITNGSVIGNVKEPLCDLFLEHWRKALLKNPYLNLNQWYETIGVENKQGIISSRESNEIVKKLSLKTYEAEYKILILWMPEKLHNTASNKLLKLLEEPPEKTLFILVCQDQEQMLPTVLSRTQLIKILKIEEEAIIDGLVTLKGLDREEAKNISFLCEGNYNEALRMMEEDENQKLYATTFVSWMRLCYTAKVPEVIEWTDNIATFGRERQKSFLQYAIQMIRESLLLSYSDKKMIKVSGEILDFLIKFAPFIHGANCVHINNELNSAHSHIERNAHPKILFLDLSFKMMKLLKVKY